MPKIVVKQQARPTVPDHITEKLRELNPPVYLKWNPRYEKRTRSDGIEVWEPRWVIYSELPQSYHPDAGNVKSDIDIYDPERGVWMRRLQTYETEDGEFAKADMGLVKGLRMMDHMMKELGTDQFYEDTLVAADEREEEEQRKKLRDAAAGSKSYYDSYDNPIVGPDTLGNWRHRIR